MIEETFHVTKSIFASFISTRRSASRKQTNMDQSSSKRFLSRSFINGFLERTEHNGQPVEPGWESRLDLDSNEITIKGSSNTTRVSKKQVRLNKKLFFKVLAKANPSGGCRAHCLAIHAAMGERLHASSS